MYISRRRLRCLRYDTNQIPCVCDIRTRAT
nr:MAG TPA: hypothetical protein [Microviridae sp.]